MKGGHRRIFSGNLWVVHLDQRGNRSGFVALITPCQFNDLAFWPRRQTVSSHQQWRIPPKGAPLFTSRDSTTMTAATRGSRRAGADRRSAPIRSAEVREIFRSYMRAEKYCDRSYREIAFEISRESGRYTSHATVVRWMAAEFPDVAESMSENSPHWARA